MNNVVKEVIIAGDFEFTSIAANHKYVLLYDVKSQSVVFIDDDYKVRKSVYVGYQDAMITCINDCVIFVDSTNTDESLIIDGEKEINLDIKKEIQGEFEFVEKTPWKMCCTINYEDGIVCVTPYGKIVRITGSEKSVDNLEMPIELYKKLYAELLRFQPRVPIKECMACSLNDYIREFVV